MQWPQSPGWFITQPQDSRGPMHRTLSPGEAPERYSVQMHARNAVGAVVGGVGAGVGAAVWQKASLVTSPDGQVQYSPAAQFPLL